MAAGCAKVGPDYAAPDLKVADNWLEKGDKRVTTEPAAYRNWWRVFNDPVLDRLIDTAYRENLPLRVAGVRVLEARAQLGVATGQLYPQTQQAFGNLQRLRLSQHSPQAAFTTNLSYYQSEAGVMAGWELDFWGKFRRAIEAADATLNATIADYDNALVSLTGDVAASYIQIRTLGKRLQIGHQSVATQTETLKIAEARFRHGTTTQRDVEQAKTILTDTMATIPALEIQLRQAENALCTLMGMPPSQLTDVLKGPQEVPAPPAAVALGIPADLVRRRPDIRAAESRAMAQCASIGVTKAELYPAFSLSGTFSFLASTVAPFTLADMLQWRSRNAAAGPAFQWNILNYGQITNQVRVQDARFQELLLGYQNAVLQAQQQVEDSLTGFLRSQSRARMLAESVGSARRSFDLAILQYQGGTVDFTTVLSAQQALLKEQDSLASTLGDISGNLVGVYRALGGGWELREGQDFVPESIKAEMARRTNWGQLLTPAAHTPTPGESKILIRPPDW